MSEPSQKPSPDASEPQPASPSAPEHWAVCGCLAIDLEDQSQDETDESIYAVAGSKLEALIALERIVFARGIGYIPDAEILKVVQAGMKARNALDISKAFRIGALAYYVRETTEEEMRSWIDGSQVGGAADGAGTGPVVNGSDDPGQPGT